MGCSRPLEPPNRERWDKPKKKSFLKKYSGTGASCLLLGPPGFNWCFSFAPVSVSYSAPRDLHGRAAYLIC